MISAALKCADVMQAEGLTTNGVNFMAFASWVQSKLCICTTDITTVQVVSDQALHNFLTAVASPNMYTCYTKEQIADKVRTQSHAQVFRVVQGCVSRRSHSDTRVRDLVEDLLERMQSFSPYELVCSFFSSTSSSKRTHAKKPFDNFNTKPATRFEQLFFVSALVSLHDIRRWQMSKNKNKRRKKIR